MGNVKSIEKAVEALPSKELAEFRSWLAVFDAAAWDRQTENDASSGKLDQLAAEALSDFQSGSAELMAVKFLIERDQQRAFGRTRV